MLRGVFKVQAPKARPGEGGSTIDFSALFDELDSDLGSDSHGDTDSDGDVDDATGPKKVELDYGDGRGMGESNQSSAT